MFWPVMKGRRIKVCAAWPDHRVNFRINANLRKKGGIAERAEQLTFQNRLEINITRQGFLQGTTFLPPMS